MADHAALRRRCEADREALAEATTEVLEVYANLVSDCAASIARRSAHLEAVDSTLHKVRDLMANG